MPVVMRLGMRESLPPGGPPQTSLLMFGWMVPLACEFALALGCASHLPLARLSCWGSSGAVYYGPLLQPLVVFPASGKQFSPPKVDVWHSWAVGVHSVAPVQPPVCFTL